MKSLTILQRTMVFALWAASCALFPAIAQEATQSTSPQEHSSRWELMAHAGLNIGASTPVPVPKAVKKIYTWYPKLNPVIGIKAIYRLNPSGKSYWGLYTGVQSEFKGMEATTAVKDLKIALGEGDEVINGSFTGDNLTAVRNGYLTLPLGITYGNPSGRFQIQSGLYFSLLLQGSFKVIIDGKMLPQGETTALILDLLEFDFSDKLRATDMGWQAVFNYKLNRNLGIQAAVSTGFGSVARRDFEAIPFKLHNLYASVGFSYRLADY